MVAHAIRVLAAQYTHEIVADLAITDRSVDGVARLHAELLRCSGQAVACPRASPERASTSFDHLCPFPAPCEDLRRALFEFQVAGSRILNGRLRVGRERHDPGEVWTNEDTGRWLW